MEVRESLHDAPGGNVKLAEAFREDGVQFQVNDGRGYLFVKRAFDVVACCLALAICAIPMGVIALLIRLESAGPAIYMQERLGKDGVPFVMYKFRSMRLDAEKTGAQWADVNDSRCTRFGSFLRKYHVDELPQLLNIIRGEMSIVGPRPERECFYKEFAGYIPHFQERLRVTPGLTGWAQVNGCYDLLPEEKVLYDIVYMQNRCVWMDLDCMMKTILLILSRKGAR